MYSPIEIYCQPKSGVLCIYLDDGIWFNHLKSGCNEWPNITNMKQTKDNRLTRSKPLAQVLWIRAVCCRHDKGDGYVCVPLYNNFSVSNVVPQL